MFVVEYRQTMKNARPVTEAVVAPIVRSMDQVRSERMARDAVERTRVSERDARERRRREILGKIEYSLNRYREDNVPSEEKLPIRDILKAICEFHGVTVDAVMGRGRQRFMTEIRDEAIRAVADARPRMSLPELGRVFAGRDHTTIRFSLLKTAKPGFDYRGNKLPVDSGKGYLTL